MNIIEKYELTYSDGTKLVHFGHHAGEDRTLCGMAHEGGIEIYNDGYRSEREFTPVKKVNLSTKVTCPDCISIVKFCKKVVL